MRAYIYIEYCLIAIHKSKGVCERKYMYKRPLDGCDEFALQISRPAMLVGDP